MDDGSADGFFRHHGLWAPGVRLFRRLQFRAKAAMVSVMFLVPVAVLGWSFYEAKASAIEFSAKERLGIEYIRELMPALRLAVAQRAGTDRAEDADLSGRLAAQMRRVDAVEQRLGGELGTGPLHAKLVEAFRAAASTGATAEATLAARTRFVGALIDVLGQATDGSNLILDPDLDTYYLMDLSTTRVPQLIELVARLQLAGPAALSGDPAALRLVGDRLPLAEYHEEQARIGVAKSTGATPELVASLKAEPVAAALRAFVEQSRAGFGANGQGDARAHSRAASAVLDSQFEFSSRLLDELDRLIDKRIAAMRAVRDAVSMVVALALAAGVYLFYCFYRVMRGGLQEVQRHLEAMTDGDLTTEPRPWGRDEPARLMVSLSQMQASLRGIVSRVRGSSEQLVQASGEIASAASDLSARTEQTAASLEEGAASMEQITATIRQTADSAEQAAGVATDNSGHAERSGAVIAQVVSTMQEIQASSGRIGDIIGVIDGIAFQTNILALNAAVEAARAGDQGRGFAVVAGEVRTLAQRSAQAAREIKALISASVERVDSGTRVVRDAGGTLGQLLDNAHRMDTLLREISTAVREESAGVIQLGGTVQGLDRMTQENAALVEQTAAAAGSLKLRAEELAAEVARFRLA